ncbi:DUF3995 domain-containing protein [Flavobacterium sp. AG291]|uniref:DUF3995 domain-containing protein n=1 Tax=Flavobacterium sp. AG291 TaxID=2184000 RepID=UPI000E0B1491|nr:DUF3995 domain-containing protein [Flavobacterium sp. AG291]RDI14652.1 uncharacterized protein DUF3995 [Flavobacterium sp. AG291]
MIFFILINTVIFIMLSFIHVYWAINGSLGKEDVIPTLPDGKAVFEPGIVGTFAVAALLGIFAFVTVGDLGIYNDYLSDDFIKYATLAIGILFLLRAIGDFKYVGFFKTIKETLFAKNDSRYFSPLCLYLGLSSIAIALIQ